MGMRFAKLGKKSRPDEECEGLLFERRPRKKKSYAIARPFRKDFESIGLSFSMRRAQYRMKCRNRVRGRALFFFFRAAYSPALLKYQRLSGLPLLPIECEAPVVVASGKASR